MKRPHRILALVLQLLLVHLAIAARPMACAAAPATAIPVMHASGAHDAHSAHALHGHGSPSAPAHERHGAGHCETSCLPATCSTATAADLASRGDETARVRGELSRAPRARAVASVARGPEPPPPRA